MKPFVAIPISIVLISLAITSRAVAREGEADRLPAPVIELSGQVDVDAVFQAYQARLDAGELPAYDEAYRDRQVRDELLKTWYAYGYYDADIVIEPGEGRTLYRSVAGPLYHIGGIRHAVGGEGAQALEGMDVDGIIASGLKPGEPALAAQILAVQRQLQAKLASDYCLFSHEVAHEATINHLTREMDLFYNITAGRTAHFGEVRFSGLETFAADYVRKLAPIQQGQCFTRKAVNDGFLGLQRSGHFATVHSVLPPEPADDGEVDVTFEVSEGAQRTIKAGANFSTDIGPGVTLGWEHRNILSRGEKFNTNLSLTTVQRFLDTQVEKPFFLRDDQRLRLGALLEQQDTDAFQTNGLTFTAQVERSFRNQWRAATGASYGFRRVDDPQSVQNFALFSLPSYLSKDARDNMLNPRAGWNFRTDITPFVNTLDANTAFFKSRVSGSYYLSADWDGQPTLAVRAATGSILGVPTEEVPASERFYAGGGGSVRGYGFQEVGPLDRLNKPLGGRSFIESSVEIRVRVSEDYGVVAFMDGGNVFDASYPDFEDGLRFGGGVGLRYFTDFGPLRADIAAPLNKRRGVDDTFQLYFSIGQAF